MFLEIYYFHFILEKKYKINTILDSIKLDLEKFFIYYFNKKLVLNRQEQLNNISYFLFIDKDNENIQIPKLIFQIEGHLTEKQINELLEIFLKHGEERFILNYDGFKLEENKFLQINKITNFLNQSKIIFEKFIKEYSKVKIIDESSKIYKNFRKSYSLLLYIYYSMLSIYQQIQKETKRLKNNYIYSIEYKSNIDLLKKRLSINEETLEKNIIIYNQFLEKIIKILKSFDK